MKEVALILTFLYTLHHDFRADNLHRLRIWKFSVINLDFDSVFFHPLSKCQIEQKKFRCRRDRRSVKISSAKRSTVQLNRKTFRSDIAHQRCLLTKKFLARDDNPAKLKLSKFSVVLQTRSFLRPICTDISDIFTTSARETADRRKEILCERQRNAKDNIDVCMHKAVDWFWCLPHKEFMSESIEVVEKKKREEIWIWGVIQVARFFGSMHSRRRQKTLTFNSWNFKCENRSSESSM